MHPLPIEQLHHASLPHFLPFPVITGDIPIVSTVGRQLIMPMVVGGHAAGRYLFKSYDGVARTKT